MLAEDEGFEPSVGFPTHAFQACALGRYANPPAFATISCKGRTLSVLQTMIHRRSSVRRYFRGPAIKVFDDVRTCQGGYEVIFSRSSQ